MANQLRPTSPTSVIPAKAGISRAFRSFQSRRSRLSSVSIYSETKFETEQTFPSYRRKRLSIFSDSSLKRRKHLRHTGESRYLPIIFGLPLEEIPAFAGMTLLHFTLSTVSKAGTSPASRLPAGGDPGFHRDDVAPLWFYDSLFRRMTGQGDKIRDRETLRRQESERLLHTDTGPRPASWPFAVGKPSVFIPFICGRTRPCLRCVGGFASCLSARCHPSRLTRAMASNGSRV